MINPIPTLDPARYWQNNVGWWQDINGVTPSVGTDPIGRWDDQSGNDGHLIQTVLGNRPTRLVDSGFKTQPSVSFDHTMSQFLSDSTFNETSNVTQGTWVVAFQRDALSRSQAILAPHATQVLGIYDSAGNLFFEQQFANNQYTTYRDQCYHGKAVIAVFDGSLNAASRFRFRINKTDRVASAQLGSLNAVTATVSAGLEMGRSSGASYLTGHILEAAYFPYALTTIQIQSIESYWEETFFGQGEKKVHVLGDSVPKGYPFDSTNGLDWPTQLSVLLGSPWSVQSVCVVAYMIAQMELSGGTIDRDRDEWRVEDDVILECGTNDGVLGRTASEALADMAISVSKRKLYGFNRVIVQTLPYAYAPASGQPITQEAYEVFRSAYNSGVRSGATGADEVFDLQAEPGFEDPINLDYYTGDKIHLMSSGSTAVSEAAWRVLTYNTGPPEEPDILIPGSVFLGSGIGIRRGARP